MSETNAEVEAVLPRLRVGSQDIVRNNPCPVERVTTLVRNLLGARIAAPAPLAGAALVESVGLPVVFVASVFAAVLQFVTVRRLRGMQFREAEA